MRKKINRRFTAIALFSIVITTVVMTKVFYAQLKKQVFSDLKDVAELLIEEGSYENATNNLRITIISSDGSVSFDSTMDAQSLENHLDRPEVSEALKDGTGMGERISNTISESVFYYAVKMDNGQILRVGKQAGSVFAMVISSLPVIIIVMAVLAVICMILSHYLTADIIRPIDEMAGDMDHISEINTYPELTPFAKKIRNQHDEIISAANMRQEFTANVSHELKTPLAAISGYAELMEAGIVKEEDITRFCGEIRKNAARLLTLINDTIRLSQLDAGNAMEILEDVNIAETAKESVEMLSVNAAGNLVSIHYNGVDEAYVRLGKELAQELLFNLISNAVKYNKPGGKVFVSVEKNDRYISLVVQDTGIGISDEHKKRVFERFYRADKSRSRELGGTGLGLAIVKHICTLTEGEITLESKVDVGTTVTIVWSVKNS